MITLQKASLINSELNRILIDGNSDYLSDSIVYRTHSICNTLRNLNSESILFKEYHSLNGPNFIDSLEVDGIKVIYQKETKYDYCGYSIEYFVDKEKIRELSNPASFGKGSETVYDENIRKAFEITADRISIKEKNNLKNYIDTDNIPLGKKFIYKLYKMHIYKEGGKFERHKDTIHSPSHYGTLIICLNKDYYDIKGGQLLLYKNKGDLTPLHKFDNYGSIMFLTDVEHEVTEIKKGTRIVLQYDVYLEDEKLEEDSNKENEYDEDEDEDKYYDSDCLYNKEVKKYLSNQEYVNSVKNKELLLLEINNFVKDHPEDQICILLSREYPLCVSIDCLKVSDKLVYDILSKDYDLELGYVVNTYTSDYEGSYNFDEKEKLKVMNYIDIQNFLNKFNNNINSPNPKKIIKTHLFCGNAKFYVSKQQDYVEHTGNEAAPAEYTYTSLVLALRKKE
jgi:hypothetical protein